MGFARDEEREVLAHFLTTTNGGREGARGRKGSGKKKSEGMVSLGGGMWDVVVLVRAREGGDVEHLRVDGRSGAATVCAKGGDVWPG